jgi:hypothetical protein
MYATAVFDFNQADNGWLMSEFSFTRSLFLIFLFPRIVSHGRNWYTAGTGQAQRAASKPTRVAAAPEEFDAPMESRAEEETLITNPAEESREACAFDLFFLRWSLVVDGALTTVVAFATKGWHIYLGKYYSTYIPAYRTD